MRSSHCNSERYRARDRVVERRDDVECRFMGDDEFPNINKASRFLDEILHLSLPVSRQMNAGRNTASHRPSANKRPVAPAEGYLRRLLPHAVV